MGLRDALVHFDDHEKPADFMVKALAAAKAVGGSGRLRLELGPAFSLNDGTVHASASLWVERGQGRTESWQRVTGSIMGRSYVEVLGLFGPALDAGRI